MRMRLGQRDRSTVARSRLLWRRVHDELRNAAGWRPRREEWTFAGQILPGGVEVRAVLVGTPSTGGIAIRSRIEIQRHSKLEHPYADEVRRVLRARGYVQFRPHRADETTSLSRSIGHTELADERRWLAALLGSTDGPAPSSPRTMAAFSASFDAKGPGPWLPYRGAWERRRAIEIGGRKMEAGVMLHLAPRDLRGFSLELTTSISIWPSWNGPGPLPKWLEARRALLARQFRAVGHRAEWHRGPEGRGVGIMSLLSPRPPVKVHRIRLILDSVELGDNP
jgi:hypothetical protein